MIVLSEVISSYLSVTQFFHTGKQPRVLSPMDGLDLSGYFVQIVRICIQTVIYWLLKDSQITEEILS